MGITATIVLILCCVGVPCLISMAILWFSTNLRIVRLRRENPELAAKIEQERREFWALLCNFGRLPPPTTEERNP